MNKQSKILINSSKNINSVNTDSYERLEITNNEANINEYDIRNVINAQEVYQDERDDNSIYRIYGKIEYLSLFNGLANDYSVLGDFFNPQTGDCKTFLNSFDFYLVKPSTGYTEVVSTGDYIRKFEVVATPDNIEFGKAGFANNVFNEETYFFDINIDIDLTYNRDDFGFPITSLYLYAQYKNISDPTEEYKIKSWIDDSYTAMTSIGIFHDFVIGDIIYVTLATIGTKNVSDIIEYEESQFSQNIISNEKFSIITPYINDVGTPKTLYWEYNPLIPLELRYFSSDLNNVNSGGTSYDLIQSIPDYATNYPVGTDNFVWRDIQSEGYSDPISGVGNDIPFLNKKRYYFDSIVFSLIPDITNEYTKGVFEEVVFSLSSTTQTFLPISDINKINSPCQ